MTHQAASLTAGCAGSRPGRRAMTNNTNTSPVDVLREQLAAGRAIVACTIDGTIRHPWVDVTDAICELVDERGTR